MNTPFLQLKTIVFFCFFAYSCLAQKTQPITIVKGQVFDSTTNEKMPFVNVQFEGSGIGLACDIDGNFYLETQNASKKLKISYVGYQTQTVSVSIGTTNNYTIKLKAGSMLNEVVIKVPPYRNKGNPAVELIKKVIENKSKNRSSNLAYYTYSKYDKVELALNNVTEKMKNNFIFRGIKFVFENVDTNKFNGKVSWPFYFREALTDVYYRKSPNALREIKQGDKQSNLGFLDKEGISSYVQNMYQDVDLYDDAVYLFTTQFTSPLSPIAPNIYRFYILDTVKFKGDSCVRLYFAPRNKTDLAFIGRLYVSAKDSSYAVRKIDIGVPGDINLNWVSQLTISQEYDFVQTPGFPKGLMLTKDELVMDYGLGNRDSVRTVMGKKTTSYNNYVINKPIPDAVFTTADRVTYSENLYQKNDSFWVANRHDTLNKVEKGVYQTMDSLNNNRKFKTFITIAKLALEGYASFGGFDLGPMNASYSFNDIEGLRLRLGGRTNPKFSNKWNIEGYTAYGFKDQHWKELLNVRYNFANSQILKYPLNEFRAFYSNEIKIPGQNLQFVNEDNLFLSFKRGINDKMIYTESIGGEYVNENRNGFSYTLNLKNTKLTPAGNLKFVYNNAGEMRTQNFTQTSDASLTLRYAPHDKFYQGAGFRIPILTKYPIFSVTYAQGFKDVFNGQFNYGNLNLSAEKVFYLSPLGYADITFEAGRTFGQVPFPYLTIHHANQTYGYQYESFNLMNYLEFVSDKYASINIYYNMSGFIFNRIPLIKKLKLREVFTFKALWGGVDAKNIPSAENGLFKFPTDAVGNPLTFTLGSRPYMEGSVGIANIFKFVRIDYMWRLSYLDNPNVTKGGIRFRIKLDY